MAPREKKPATQLQSPTRQRMIGGLRVGLARPLGTVTLKDEHRLAKQGADLESRTWHLKYRHRESMGRLGGQPWQEPGPALSDDFPSVRYRGDGKAYGWGKGEEGLGLSRGGILKGKLSRSLSM